ncbi:L-ribulose-5-phosphate 3-epimerase [Clostridium tarantellae]|uniref:L-ribulose-5-phosphate 3-epimerase n=1 Tax=Clostridium tarantellae TaxID=39493 RepID=A0A6I1MNC8_9CLOT|nr:L-ribulose-5-phosphate 3-epimerase [Clostridium tarantellae]MPQ44263.1 L-ribulose-5-phosphate 3-epimerase [Clostridium tarantellae]
MKKYELGLYEKSMPNNLSWAEKFICAKDAGFDFIEISIDESDEKLARLDYSKEERIAIVKEMFEIGVPIRTMCLSGHRKYPIGSSKESIRNKGMEIMEKAIDLACDLGIRIIQLAGYDVYYEESTDITKELFVNNLKKCVDMAAEKGVILAFETMETEFMNTVKKAMNYVKIINSPYLQVYPDCGNITNAAVKYENSVIEDLKSGKGHITSVHLKETVPGVFREVPFGTGHVNFKEIIKTSWELGVRKFVAEFWYVGNNDWINILKETRIFMDNNFKEALSK